MLPGSSGRVQHSEMTEGAIVVMDDSSDGDGIDIEHEFGMVLGDDNGMAVIDCPSLNSSSITLSDNSQCGGFSMSHFALPDVAGMEEVAEEVHMGSTWDSLNSTPSMTQDCGIEGDASPDLLLSLVEDAIGPMTVLTSLPSNERKEDGMIHMYDYKDDFISVHEQFKLEDMDQYGTPDYSTLLKVKEEPPSELELYDDDSLSFKVSQIVNFELNQEQADVKPFAEVTSFTYNCPECDTNFSSPKSFKGHMEVHLQRLQNSCALCDREFATKTSLQEHIKDHFIRSASSSCDICQQDFPSKPLMMRHRKQVHESPENILAKCDICNTVFSSKFALKTHLATHNNRKPYGCVECGATFTQNGSLQVHLRRHRGEKPFKCDLCGNHFTRAHSLKVHMKTHTGEKPYRCEYCGACFATSSHLTVHRRTHTGERPYSCGECGATFITTSHLNVHRRHHDSSNLYQSICTICGAAFDDPAKLRQHKKVHKLANRRFNPYQHKQSCKKFSEPMQFKSHD